MTQHLKNAEGEELLPAQQGEFGAYYERFYNQFVKLANPPAGYSPSSVSIAQQTQPSPEGTRPELALGAQPGITQEVQAQPITQPEVTPQTNAVIAPVPIPNVQPSAGIPNAGIPQTGIKSAPTSTAPVAPPVAPPATPKQTSLVDVYNSRLDLQKAFPDALTPGSPANQQLNDWWNTHGINEYPGTGLVAPGTAGIQDPKTLAASGPQAPETTTETQIDAQGVETGKTTTTIEAVQAPSNQTSLVDIWDSRPDLQQAFPNQGKDLDNWWNQYGVKEYPNTQLVAPGAP